MACWLLLTLWAAAASAQLISIHQETSLRPGRKYIYSYETQDLAGVSTESDQKSGLRLKCNVHLETRDGVKITAKMEDVVIMKLNKELEHLEPDTPLPDSDWTAVRGPDADTLSQLLQQPFRYSVVRGGLADLETQPGEPLWCINAKRGFLSAIQLNLRGPSDNLSTYQVWETDVTGECQTAYSKKTLTQYSDVTETHVTKAKDFHHCRKRPVFHNQMFNTMITSEFPTLRKNMTTAELQGDYQVQGGGDNFLLKWAKVVGRQYFLSLPAEKGTLMTWTLQVVRLMRVHEMQASMLKPSAHLQQQKSLVMEQPEVTSSQVNQRTLNEHEISSMVAMMETLLNELVTMTTPHVTENTPHVVGNITWLMTQLPTSRIETIVTKYCYQINNINNIKKCDVIIDLLPMLKKGAEVLPIVRQLVQRQLLADVTAGVVITANALSSPPCPRHAQALIEMFKQLQATGVTRQLPTSCILSAGSIVFKLQEVQRDPASMQPNLTPHIDRLAEELVSTLQAESDPQRKLVIVKAMGNAGHARCVPQLKSVIESSTHRVQLREQAVYALRRVAPYHKPVVTNILMPIYLQQNLPQELRTAAFLVLMKSEPSYSVVRMLSSQLHKEQTRQVGCFVYTYLQAMSKCWNFCNVNTTLYIRRALSSTPAFKPSFLDSRVVHAEIFSQKAEMGVGVTNKLLNNPSSALPDVMLFKLLTNWNDLPTNLELGMMSTGIQSLLKKAFGPQSLIKDLFNGRLSLYDVMTPVLQNTDPTMLQHIRDVMNQISVTERSLQDVQAAFFVKFMQEESLYFNMDKQTMTAFMQYMIRSGPAWLHSFSNPVAIDTLRTVSVLEVNMNMPTASGLCMHMNTSIIAVLGVRGSIQIQNAPSFRQILSLVGRRNSQSESMQEMIIKLDIVPSFALYIDIGVSVTLGVYGAGVKANTRVQAKYPINIHTKVHPETGKFKVNFIQENQDKRVFTMTFDPVIYTCKRPSPASLRWMIDEKELTLPIVRQEAKTNTLPCPYLGKVFILEYVYPVFTQPTPLIAFFYGKTAIFVVERSTQEAPREVHMEAWYLSPGSERPQSLIERMLQNEYRPRQRQQQRGGWWFTNPVQQPVLDDEQSVQFQQVQIDSQIRNSVKRQLIVAVRTVGATADQEVQLQLTHVHSQDLKKHQQNLQMIIRPSSSRSQMLKLDMKTHLDELEKYMNDKETIPTEKLLSKVELHYGQRQYPTTLVDIEVKLPAGQQQMWQQQPEWLRELNPVTLRLDIQYQEVPRKWEMFGETCRHIIKSLTVIVPETKLYVEKSHQHTPNRVTVITNINTMNGKMNVSVISPWELDNVTNIPVPFINDRKYSLVSRKLASYHDNAASRRGQCQLMREQLRTFDGKKIFIPRTDCEVKLAKDCSSSTYPKFMVTAKKLDKDDEKKIVYIYLPQHKIKIQSKQGWLYNQIEVEVNDRKMALTSDGQQIIIQQDNSFNGEKLVEIKKLGARVEVYCFKSGLKVKTDCNDVKIKADGTFHAQLCGLCANYNGEQVDDMTGPQLEIYRRPAQLLLSYVLNPSSCNADQLRQQLQVPTNDCRTQYKTVVMERERQLRRVTCFSVRQVAKCAAYCNKHGERRQLVGFHCLPAANSATQRLLQQVQAGQRVPELQQLPADVYEYVSTQDSCRA